MFWRWLSKFLFLKVWGWQLKGINPADVPKCVVVVFPHTSNWDFPIGIFVRPILGADIKFLAKNSLFKWPMGSLFRALGGYPVERSKNTNFVDAVVDLFNSKKEFRITVTPEGTRKKVTTLRTGFYYIATKANVPIVLCSFDWQHKIVTFGEPFYAGTYEEVFEKMKAFFKGVKGRIPEFGYDFDNA